MEPDLSLSDEYLNRRITKTDIEDYEGAIYDLTQAISIKHDLGAAWYFRGLALYKLNKQAEALDNLNKAFDLGYKGKGYDE
jgi:tetratricopeptide (TPR) repeat protein